MPSETYLQQTKIDTYDVTINIQIH